MIRKRITALAVALGLAGLSYGFMGGLLLQPRQAVSAELHQARLRLRRMQRLLASKEILNRKWSEQRAFFESPLGAQDAFNAWVGKFSAYSQEQNLIFEKMEPLGIKGKEREKQMELFLAFHGDIRVLVRFIYFLLEKEPLTRVLSLELRQEDPADASPMDCQMILAKAFNE